MSQNSTSLPSQAEAFLNAGASAHQEAETSNRECQENGSSHFDSESDTELISEKDTRTRRSRFEKNSVSGLIDAGFGRGGYERTSQYYQVTFLPVKNPQLDREEVFEKIKPFCQGLIVAREVNQLPHIQNCDFAYICLLHTKLRVKLTMTLVLAIYDTHCQFLFIFQGEGIPRTWMVQGDAIGPFGWFWSRESLQNTRRSHCRNERRRMANIFWFHASELQVSAIANWMNEIFPDLWPISTSDHILILQLSLSRCSLGIENGIVYAARRFCLFPCTQSQISWATSRWDSGYPVQEIYHHGLQYTTPTQLER